MKIHYAGIFDEKPENLPTNNKNHNSIIIINKINNYIVCPLLMIIISIPIALKYKYSFKYKNDRIYSWYHSWSVIIVST